MSEATKRANLEIVSRASGDVVPVEKDFIEGYAEYADVLEAPRIHHEIAGIQLVAAVLNSHGVFIQHGVIKYSLDLWTVLLSGSGAGRSTTLGLTRPILEAAQLENLEISVRWGSGPAFYQHFSEHPCGLHFWGEMAEKLKTLNDPQFRTAKEWMTDRYDDFKIPSAFVYRSTGREGDTPSIVFPKPPRTNILATSSEDWFFRNLAETDSTGGFLTRWLILRAEGERRIVPIPLAADSSLVPALATSLKAVSALSGPADLSKILPEYRRWYVEAMKRFESQANSSLAMAFWNRHRGHILKLAVIFEASETASLEVGDKAWKRAVRFMDQIEQSTFNLCRNGMNATGYDLQRIEERIKKSGKEGLSRSELTRAFQGMNSRERQQHIETLVEAGRIQPVSVRTATRPRTAYVHEDLLK